MKQHNKKPTIKAVRKCNDIASKGKGNTDLNVWMREFNKCLRDMGFSTSRKRIKRKRK